MSSDDADDDKAGPPIPDSRADPAFEHARRQTRTSIDETYRIIQASRDRLRALRLDPEGDPPPGDDPADG